MDISTSNHSMTGGGANVIVCVLDDGVEPIGNLTGRAYAVNYSSKAGVNRQGSHGTAVASVVIDHCPEAIIYSYNIRDTGYQVDAIHAALADILARAKSDTRRYIVNMSFAGDGNTSNASIAEMERRVNLLVEANVPVVVGAGNDGEDVTGNKWPSCFREVICVSALKNDGTRAQFSAWHNEVDFGELGDPVQALDINGAMRGMAGTSFATPIVAAKCATLLSRYPNMTEPELYEVLKANAQDMGDAGRDPYTGWGWIAGLEVDATPEAPEPPEPPEPPAEEEKEDEPVDSESRLLYLSTPRMEGADVFALETKLEKLGYDCKMTSAERSSGRGIFGPACDAAVRTFQKDYLVDVYGKAGQFTLAAMDKALVNMPPESAAARHVEYLDSRVGDVYVWGAQGENLLAMDDPEGWIERRETSAANAARAIAKFRAVKATGRNPIRAYDCSGLIVWWLLEEKLIKGDTSSRGLYRLCTPLKGTDALVAGKDLLFRTDSGGVINHVGVYVGNGMAIEAKGRDDGVVKRSVDVLGSDGVKYWKIAGRLNLL